MLVRDVLQKTTQFFRDKGIDTARLDTELLLSKALQWERMAIYLRYEYPLSEPELQACRDLVKRRAAGEPVAYILGEKGFYNHAFKVTPAVLIPRPETEMIVEKALEFAKTLDSDLRVVDLGSGSGCIGLSIVAARENTRLLGVDLSVDAIQVAKDNATQLEVTDRSDFMSADAGELNQNDVEAVLGGLANMVVSNPPYIAHDDPDVQASVKKFEPSMALFSDDNGLAHIKAWVRTAARIAAPGAFVMFEIGYNQGALAQGIFSSEQAFEKIEVVKDLAGHDRFVRCFRASL